MYEFVYSPINLCRAQLCKKNVYILFFIVRAFYVNPYCKCYSINFQPFSYKQTKYIFQKVIHIRCVSDFRCIFITQIHSLISSTKPISSCSKSGSNVFFQKEKQGGIPHKVEELNSLISHVIFLVTVHNCLLRPREQTVSTSLNSKEISLRNASSLTHLHDQIPLAPKSYKDWHHDSTIKRRTDGPQCDFGYLFFPICHSHNT